MSAQPTEFWVQCAIVELLGYLGLVHYAIPNEESSRAAPAARATHRALAAAKGVRSGAADLVIIGAGGLSLHMEVKKPHPTKSAADRLSATQRIFRADLAKLDAVYVAVASVDEAKACLRAWLGTIAKVPLPPLWQKWARGKLEQIR